MQAQVYESVCASMYKFCFAITCKFRYECPKLADSYAVTFVLTYIIRAHLTLYHVLIGINPQNIPK